MGNPVGVSRSERRTNAGLRVRVCLPADVGRATVAAWAELEHRAVESNAYLSPHFIIPAARHLATDSPPVVVLIDSTAGGVRDLVGVGVFDQSGPTRRFPLPHLRAFRSRHSFLSGLLVDKERAAQTVSAFLEHFCGADRQWHGVEFRAFPLDGPLNPLLHEAAVQHGAEWFEYGREERAMLIPARGGDAYVAESLPGDRRKDLQRRMRRLQEQGAVQWRVVRGEEISTDHIEAFLNLEHRGWKGQDGTSLRANAGDEAFFHEMIAGFRGQGRAVFTELCLDGRPIASTTNLISGDAGFAFKLGWDPAFAKMAPGVLNEIELVRNAKSVFQGLTYVDSGAAPGSFMDEIWVSRRGLVSGAFTVSSFGRQALAAIQRAARWKQSLAALRHRFLSLAAIIGSIWGFAVAYTLNDLS